MKFKKNMLPLLSACLFVATSMSTLAHGGEESDIERAIDYRQSIMTLFGWNMKPMGAMMKGKLPYDQAAFAHYAKELGAAAKLDLLAGFPEDSEGDESDALADIWLDFEDFKQKYSDFKSAANTLSQATDSGDNETIKTAFGKLGKTCKACHKGYKN